MAQTIFTFRLPSAREQPAISTSVKRDATIITVGPVHRDMSRTVYLVAC